MVRYDSEEGKNEILQCLVGYEWLTMVFCLPSSWAELILLYFPFSPEISRSPKLSSPWLVQGCPCKLR